MIQLGIREHDTLDRRPAHLTLRPQRPKRFDLAADVRGGVEQKPPAVIGAKRDGRLRARTAGPRAIAHRAAVRTIAVPLGEATAGSRAQHTHPHGCSPFLATNADRSEARVPAASRAGKDGSTTAAPARVRAGAELYSCVRRHADAYQ